jgi:hypothetical protein
VVPAPSLTESLPLRTGAHRALELLSALRDAVPSLRKSLIAFARK